MGLFDNLVKAFNDSGLKDGISEVGKELEKTVNTVGSELNNLNGNKTVKTVPSEYSHFPQFNCLIKDVTTKNIDKYHRCTIDYKDVTEDQVNAYISKIEEVGFKKGSDVRYDRDNTYIILEKDIPSLHLVFHVKH